MIRWPIQVLGFVLYALALGYCIKAYSSSLRRWYLGPVLAWLAVQVLFAAGLVARVIVYRGEPPVSATVNWWANMVWIAGAISLTFTFWLSGRGDRA